MLGDETHLSWVSRLAAFHIGADLSDFLHEQNVDLDGVVDGDEHAISVLGAITGIAAEQIHANTFRRRPRNVLSLRGESLTGLVRPLQELWYCPICLREDVKKASERGRRPEQHVYERLLWRFRSVVRCPVHRCAMHMQARNIEESAIPAPLLRELRFPANTKIVASTRPAIHETYIQCRLLGKKTDYWLDQHRLSGLLIAAQELGAAVTFDCQLAFGDLPAPQQNTAMRVGWHFLKSGPSGIDRALHILNRREPASNLPVKVRKRRVFGALLHNGSHSPGHQILLQQIESFSFETTTDLAA